MEAVDQYCNSDEYDEADITIWAERLDEISKIFNNNAEEFSRQLTNVLSSAPKIKAYNKTMNMELKKD